MGVCHGSTGGDMQRLQEVSGRDYQVQVRVDTAGREGGKSLSRRRSPPEYTPLK